jgi:hypothetical protein
MARILRRLSITDVASVDRGAGEGCRVVMTKRDTAGRPHRPPPDVQTGKTAALAHLEKLVDEFHAIYPEMTREQALDYVATNYKEGRQLLHMAKQEADMSSSSRCPTCNQKLPDDYEADDDAEKRHGLDVVSKASRMSVDSLLDDFRKAMPTASEAEVRKRAADSPLMNEIHKQERNARLRAQGAY